MADQNDSRFPLFGSVTIPAMLLMGLAAFSRLGSDAPLATVRPKKVQSQEQRRLTPPAPLHAVYSRLWEDPIAVAEQDAIERELKPTAPKPAVKNCSAPAKPDPTAARILQLEHYRGRLQELQEYFRGYVSIESPPVGTSKSQSKSATSLLLLPVMVPGSPYAEDSEQRKRTRYAVVSALGRAGYTLEYPTRVTYVKIPIAVEFTGGRRHDFRELVMPVKLYARRGSVATGHQKVLVCWVSEEEIGGDPVGVLEQIAEALFGCNQSAIDHSLQELQDTTDASDGVAAVENKNAVFTEGGELLLFDMKVIGPANSDTLQKMVRRDGVKRNVNSFLQRIVKRHVENRQKLQSSALASSVATDAQVRKTSDWKPEILINRATVPSEKLGIDKFDSAGDVFDGSVFRFNRVIGTDPSLAKKIAWELGNRSIAPSESNLVVLLTERDSLYGSAFPDVFKKAIKKTQTQTLEDQNEIDRRVHTITYLRGLDGMTLGNNSSDLSDDEIDRPDGRSQYDYIRRIKEQLADIEREAGESMEPMEFLLKRPAVRAIGVVGTDLYDKLLLLRSLRNHFPNVVFFTTDLDATFSYRKEYPHTRNLIVASHFGLKLNSRIQGDVLPFRGSYQTSTYLATLFAVGHLPDTWAFGPKNVRPLLFEIGRNGPFQLTQTNSLIQPLGHQQTYANPTTMLGWLLPLMLLLIIVGCQFERPRQSLMLLFVYVSDWTPTKILGVGVFNATLAFFVVVGIPVGIACWSSLDSGEPFSLTNGISAWPGIIITCLAASYATAVLILIYTGYQRGKHFAIKLCKTEVGEVLSGVRPDKRRLYQWKIIDKDPPVAIRTLLSEFVGQCRPWAQLNRVVTLFGSYAAFGCVVWALTNHGLAGIRGENLQWCSWATTFFAFVVFMLVATTTIDSVQVCRLFIKRVGNGTSGWECLRKASELTGYRDEFESVAIQSVKLIATLTEDVSKMILYTFIAAFLLLAAQYPYFEYYAIPWSTCVIILPLIAGNIVSYIMLRLGAKNARDKIVSELRHRPLLESSQSATTSEALNVLSGIRSGALAPLSHDPLIKAMSVPLGGTTGLLAIEQVLRAISG